MTKLAGAGKPRGGKFGLGVVGLLEKGAGTGWGNQAGKGVLVLTAPIGTATLTQN